MCVHTGSISFHFVDRSPAPHHCLASLLYPFMQIAGVVMATAGFVIALRSFGIRYDEVAYNHGIIGVAILVLTYSQVRGYNMHIICIKHAHNII